MLIACVSAYRGVKERTCNSCMVHQQFLSPPVLGMLKLNFDGGKVVESCWVWGFVLRSFDGDVILARTRQGAGFVDGEVKEARACLFVLKCVKEAGFDSLVIESDRLQLFKKLNAKALQDNCVGLIIHDIFSFFDSFSIFLGLLSREVHANKVAHVLDHWQPMFVGSGL